MRSSKSSLTGRGIGELLADGVKAAAENLGKGSEEFALHIKGQDTVDGIRISKGWGFGVVTSTSAGRHLRGAIHSFSPEKFLSYENVPYSVRMQEQFKAILDMTGTCLYNNGLLSWETKTAPDAASYIAELTSSRARTGSKVQFIVSLKWKATFASWSSLVSSP